MKSMFSREKPSQSGTSLPQPPTIREMIDDIESSPKNDPVILFAQVLSRRGSRKSSIDSNISEAISASPGPSRICRERSNSDSDSAISSFSSTSNRTTTHPEGSNFLEFPGMVNSSSSLVTGEHHLSSPSSSSDPTESIYSKLRHFISLSDQTQEITQDIEELIRNFEKDNKEFIELLDLKLPQTPRLK